MVIPPEDPDENYKHSRFNAVRHGVLSAYTLLPWEDEAEYALLVSALVKEYEPRGPTEDHLVEEIAGIIWRKRRLRLAEAAAHRRGLEKTIGVLSDTISVALVQLETRARPGTIVDAVNATPTRTAGDWRELHKREAMAQSALEILRAGERDAYEMALSELDESMRKSWQAELAPDSEDEDENEFADGDEQPYTADAEGLAHFLESWIFPECARQRRDIENRP